MTKRVYINLFTLLSVLACAADRLQGQDLVGQTQGTVDVKAIEQLIIELGDDSFAARQSAMKKIWRSGNLSVASLRRYARTADPEASERINRIIRHIEMGITPDTDPEVARLVFAFHNADEDQKFTTIYELRARGHHRLVMDLLMAMKDPSLQTYLAQNAYDSGGDLVAHVMSEGFDEGKLAHLDSLMDHRYMWSTHIEDCVVYWKLRGQATQRITRLETIAREDSVSDEQLMKLIWFHRQEGRPERSLEFARKLENAQPEIVQRLLLEQGDWQTLANSYRPHRDSNEGLTATQCKKAMFYYWLGNEEGFEREAGPLNPTEQRDGKSEKEMANANTVLALITMDRTRLYKHVDKMSPGFAFRILGYLQDYDRAFQLLDAPREFPEIKKWYRRLIRSMQRKINQYESRDTSRDLVEAVDLFAFLRYYATSYGTMIDADQSVELFELLADGVKLNGTFFRNWNVKLFEDVAGLEIGDDIWHFFDVLDMQSGIIQAVDILFPLCPGEAAAWYRILEESVPDARDRCKFISSLLKGPFATHQEIDFEHLISLAREFIGTHPQGAQGNLLFQVGETCRVLGHGDLAEDFWLQAGYQGYGNSFLHLGDLAAKKAEWKNAGNWYRQAARVDPNGQGPYKAALCDLKTGEARRGQDSIRQFLFLNLHSFELYRLSLNIQSTGFPDESLGLMQDYVRGQNFRNNDLFYDYQYLATLWNNKDHAQAAKNWATAIHFYLSYLDISADSGFRYHQLATRQHVATARHLLEIGETARAFETIIQCAEMASSTSSLAEELVPVLEQAGEQDLADKLFEKIADQYLKVLERYPRSALHHNNYAWICARCNRRLEEGLAHARLAVKSEPQNTSYLDTLAEHVFLQGDVEQSIKIAEQCIALNPFKEHYREQYRRFSAADQ